MNGRHVTSCAKCRPLWTYNVGTPDRSGLAVYTHLARSKFDPVETMARGSGKRDPHHWKKTASVEVWRDKIRAHLEDGEPRTFHCICVELTGTSADVWYDAAPDHALWELVESGELAWACEEGAVFFLLARFLLPEPAPEQPGEGSGATETEQPEPLVRPET